MVSMKVILLIFNALAAAVTMGNFLFVPNIITDILGHMHPSWDKDQTVGRASTYKSFLDGSGAVVAFLSLPMLGSLSDSYGRKKIMLFASATQILGSACIFAAFYFKILWVIYLSSIFSFSGGIQACSMAYVSDTSVDDKDKAKNLGIILGAFMVGTIFGLLTLGVIGQYGLFAPSLALVGIGAVNTIFFFFTFRDSDEFLAQKAKPFTLASGNPISSLYTLLNVSSYTTLLVIAYLFVFIGVSDSLTSGVLYTKYRYHWGSLEMGICGALVYTTSILWQTLGVSVLVKKFAQEKVLTATMFVAVLVHFCEGIAPSGWMYMGANIFGSCLVINFPLLQALISSQLPKEKQGVVFGGLSSLSSVAGFVGSLSSENIFASCLGKHGGYPTCPGTAFYLGAFFFFINGIMCIYLFYKHPSYRVKSSEYLPITQKEEGGETIN